MPHHTPSSEHAEKDKLGVLRNPSEASCELAVREAGALPMAKAEWSALRAPGSCVPPAPDARKIWTPLNGWTKLAVPSPYEDLEGTGQFTNTLDGWKTLPLPVYTGEIAVTADQSLPDQWPVDRNYHHAWYVLRADLGARDSRQMWLRFDAVAHSCAAFVNGKQAGRHVGGHTPFEFDVTGLLQPGPNTIALCVQDETAVADAKNRRAISQLGHGKGIINAHFAGIRGGVYLETRTPTHIERTRVRTSTRANELKVETWLRGSPAKVHIKHAVYEWPDGSEPVLVLPETEAGVGTAGKGAPVESRVGWKDPKLWSPASPNLYVLRTTVTADGGSESVDTRFGFREFWIEDRQFMLNGRPIRLLGDGSRPCELGSVVPDKSRDYGRKVLQFLKREFNYMSVRLHGEIFPTWAVLAADEAGYLVINQSGLSSMRRDWYAAAGEEFMRNMEAQYGEWYWRDVNSPSVVVWDIENELIRGRRDPDLLRWVLQLDQFIKKHEPAAIVEHSGAGWYSPEQQIIHVHMHEQYNRVMRTWLESGKAPLVLGEFWMGGPGETRLSNSYEYSDREDYHREEARLYRERMLEMRYYGVCGIMPHRLTHWPLLKAGPITSQDELGKLERPPFQWRFETVRNTGARGMAPVVGFVWPRGATVVAEEPFTREIVVCNDREKRCPLKVTCGCGDQQKQWDVTLAPAEQRRLAVEFTPDRAASEIVVEVQEESGEVIEGDRIDIHPIPRAAASPPATGRRIVVVPQADAETTEALNDLGVAYTVSEDLPADAESTIVVVPPGAADDALGRTSGAVRRYLHSGGRLLVLAQQKVPRWLPLGLPFGPAARTSVPAFDEAGWAPVNKDLMYTREAPVYAAGHPAFAHLEPCDFKEWGPVDGRISDDVYVRPNAVNVRAGAAYRVLLGATRRENASIVECRIGEGTAVFCQAQVLQQRTHPVAREDDEGSCRRSRVEEPTAGRGTRSSRAHPHPAARATLCNLLKYLDGPAWKADQPVIGLAGDLSASLPASLTGIDETAFVTVTRAEDAPPLVLAGDNADVDMLTEIAKAGGRVIVLSCETSGRLPGFEVEQDDEAHCSATRSGVEDHPLFRGVAGASFLPLEQTPARGALASIPPDARVLLAGHGDGHSPFSNDWTLDIGFYGLETREPAPPIAVGQPMGKGEIVATTLEPWNPDVEPHRQLLANLLANAGVAVPEEAGRASAIEVKRTVPLQFDGALDDWTNDMDDINISRYSHAAPVAVTSKDLVAGDVEDDLDLSAVLYLLNDDENLYVGGVIISSADGARVAIDLSGNTIQIAPEHKAVTINGKPLADPVIATGRRPAGDVIDTRLLNLTRIHKQTGKPQSLSDTPGVTFETAVPWASLGFEAPPERLRGKFQVCRGEDMLQQPVPAEGEPDYLICRVSRD